MRRPAAEAEITRQRILAVARRAFTADGYAATATSAIAAAAGVTRGALYHHFEDKAALFHAVFVQLEEELDRTVTAAALARPDPVSAFVAGCSAWLDFAVRRDYQRIAVVDAPFVLGAAEWHRIDTDIGMRSMEAGLRALDRDGALLVAATPALAVVAFGALTEAGLTLARRRRGSPSRDELLAAFLALIIRPSALGDGHRARTRRPRTTSPAGP